LYFLKTRTSGFAEYSAWEQVCRYKYRSRAMCRATDGWAMDRGPSNKVLDILFPMAEMNFEFRVFNHPYYYY